MGARIAYATGLSFPSPDHAKMATPTIVLLPGMDGTGLLFDAFVDALGQQFSVIRVSYPVDSAMDYQQLESLARLALPVQGDYLILGESFSGPIAIALAASRPAGLRGVVLCASFVRAPRPALKWLAVLARFVSPARAPGFVMHHAMLGHFGSASLFDDLKRAIEPVSVGTFAARIAAVMTVDVSDKLRAIEVPLLYICADSDRLVPASAGKYVKAICPAACIVSIAAPHLLLQVAPLRAAQVVAQFADECAR